MGKITGTQKERAKQKRAEILKAMSDYLFENPDCEICNDQAVEVHHIISRTYSITAADPENFFSVCSYCHNCIENNPKDFIEWFGEEKYLKLFRKSRGKK